MRGRVRRRLLVRVRDALVLHAPVGVLERHALLLQVGDHRLGERTQLVRVRLGLGLGPNCRRGGGRGAEGGGWMVAGSGWRLAVGGWWLSTGCGEG